MSSSGPPRARLGQWGEDAALAHLQRQGHALVARNYRCPHGEVDLITRQNDMLVFVEVKTRRTRRFGAPELAVTPGKQTKLLLTAQHYLLENAADLQPWRVDVMAVEPRSDAPPVITVFEDAVRA